MFKRGDMLFLNSEKNVYGKTLYYVVNSLTDDDGDQHVSVSYKESMSNSPMMRTAPSKCFSLNNPPSEDKKESQ